jgi:peptidoglycan/xylan/chitin deacetylase (PgdA/CDA1 family)/folate-dependent phosphoribosylglycinamide formyltransferase PurN
VGTDAPPGDFGIGHMRVVVFSADPSLGSSPWWNMLLGMRHVTDVLLCKRVPVRTPRAVLRRLRRNVAKHGLFWIPYRAAVFAGHQLRRPFRASAADAPASSQFPAVTVIETHDLHADEVLEQVRAFSADLGVSLGAPILRRSLFGLPRLGTINMHLGKVPEFRGAPPGFWELAQGTKSIGATIHWVDDGLDTGPLIAQAEAPIYERDALADVQQRAAELGTHLLRSVILQLTHTAAPGRPQPPPTRKANSSPTLRQRASLALRMAWRRASVARLGRAAVKSALLVAGLYGFRPVRDVVRRLTRRHPVRVFTYHRVTCLCRDGMTVTPEVFAEQLRYIARHHDIVPLSRGLQLIRGGARLARPAAVITFDDGYHSVFEPAASIMQRHGASGCCFVCTDLVGTTGQFGHDRDNIVRNHMANMGWTELATLLRAGWQVESHSASHPRISECHGDVLTRELEEPRRALRRELDVSADVLAYPFGSTDDFSQEALDAAVRAGYTTVFSNYKGENHTGTQSTMLARIDLGGDHTTLAWRLLSHGVDLGRLRSRRAAPLVPSVQPPSREEVAACAE